MQARRCLFEVSLLILIPVVFPAAGCLSGQVNGNLREEVMTSIGQGDYAAALEGCRTLYRSDPGNAEYRYFLGKCLVEVNRNLDEAIELLHSASDRGAPVEADFYLALAHHRSYNFRDAETYYSRYERKAGRQERKNRQIKRMIATSRSAAEITSAYNPFEVINVTFIDLLDSTQFSQIRMKGGQLQRKPARYFGPGEDRKDLNSLMFVPKTSLRGDYLYYAGKSRNGKDGFQLFRVRRGGARTWSDPEEVKALNSEGDELLPYFDPIERDLYFASDGRRGIGGFDLYRSHWDSERDEWSEPMNLGFPINSVMDEYLLLPGSDLGMVMFFTTRQGTDSTVTVYRVHLSEPRKKIIDGDSRKLKRIASLDGAAGDVLREMEQLAAESAPAVRPAGPGNRPEKPLGSKQETSPDSRNLLAQALVHQAASDSLKDLATDARVRIRNSDDPNDRWVWQKQIMLWEKKAHDEEEAADALFGRIDRERESGETAAAVNIPEAIEVDTVVEDLTVYRFKGNGPGAKEESGTTPARLPVKQAPYRGINRFDILAGSTYGPDNPVPMDVNLPPGTFYRIQLGAFGEAVEPEVFKGITPLTGERIPERGLVKYFAGKFTRYRDASSALPRVRSLGFEDAFIVAWYHGKTISTQKAKQLE